MRVKKESLVRNREGCLTLGDLEVAAGAERVDEGLNQARVAVEHVGRGKLVTAQVVEGAGGSPGDGGFDAPRNAALQHLGHARRVEHHLLALLLHARQIQDDFPGPILDSHSATRFRHPLDREEAGGVEDDLLARQLGGSSPRRQRVQHLEKSSHPFFHEEPVHSLEQPRLL